MIVKILGFLDIFTALCFFVFGIFHTISNDFILLLGLILLIKGFIFIFGGSITSGLDIISGIIIMISVSVAMPNLIIIIISLFLLQKGAISFF